MDILRQTFYYFIKTVKTLLNCPWETILLIESWLVVLTKTTLGLHYLSRTSFVELSFILCAILSFLSLCPISVNMYVVLHKWSVRFIWYFDGFYLKLKKSVSRHFEWVLTKLNWNNLEFILFYELHWSSPSHLKLKYLLTKIFCDQSDTKSSTFSYRYLQLKINATSPLMSVTSLIMVGSSPWGAPCKAVDRQQKSSLIRNLGVKRREKHMAHA